MVPWVGLQCVIVVFSPIHSHLHVNSFVTFTFDPKSNGFSCTMVRKVSFKHFKCDFHAVNSSSDYMYTPVFTGLVSGLHKRDATGTFCVGGS